MTEPQDIKYYGVEYEGSPNFDEATTRIQDKVKKYYETHQKEIDEYKSSNYNLDEIPINIFMKNIYNKQKNKLR